MINIAVLVSGGGTNLQALIDATKNGVIKSGKIKLVVSNKKDAYALVRAQNENIKSEVVCKSDFNSNEEFEEKIISVLKSNDIDLIVLAGFMCILSKNFTDAFSGRILNIHPSLIPEFCGEGFYGLRVHKAVLASGKKITGATVHYVNEIPDGGEIIMQKQVEVKKGDTPEVLQRRVMEEAEWIIYPKAVESVSQLLLKDKENN